MMPSRAQPPSPLRPTEPVRAQRQRLLKYGAALGLAAAAGAALWLWPGQAGERSAGATASVRAEGEQLFLVRGDQQRALGPGQSEQLVISDRVHTAAGRATLLLPSGSRVQMDEKTKLHLAQVGTSRDETVRLLDGSIQLQVPQRAADEYFVVLTATTKIVVHGTRFRVDLGPHARPGTACVEVQEGLAVVHTAEAAHYLGPGESAGCTGVGLPSPRVTEPKRDAAPVAPAARARSAAAKTGNAARP
jgi:ferric-dicitrate binding protein FerR (iron transport regulator)